MTGRARQAWWMAAILATMGCDAVQGLIAGTKDASGSAAQSDAPKTAAQAEAPANPSVPAPAPAAAARPAAPASKTSEAAPAAPPPAAAEPSVAEPTPADNAPADPAPTNAPSGLAAPASDTPCIVGTWEAVDYRAAIERAIHRDPELRRLKYTSSGGTLGYVVEPPTEGNAGTVRQIAEDVTYRFGGKVQGFDVALSVQLDGENVAQYELVGTDRIVVAKPTKDTMKVEAYANVKGIAKLSRSKKVDLDFDGTFVYTCEGDALKVVSAREPEGRPVTFARDE